MKCSVKRPAGAPGGAQRKLYSSTEFNTAIKGRRLSADSIAIARQVLVHGARKAHVAKEIGVSRSWVQSVVERVTALLEAQTAIPPGWVFGSLVLPPKAWATVERLERVERAKLSANKRPRAKPTTAKSSGQSRRKGRSSKARSISKK